MTEAARTPRDRPLSPHVSVWRWHVTMFTSILHRVSGVALYGAALLLTAWALSLASGPETYACFRQLAGSIPGQVVMALISLALFYHLAKGLQHLIWDFGLGFEVRRANAGAIAGIVFAMLATAALWICIGTRGVLG